MKRILITGIRRGGTTLLASLIGAHSQISVASEIYAPEAIKLVGKAYIGVKYAYPHIRYDKKYPRIHSFMYFKLSKLLNRITNALHIPFDMSNGSPFSMKEFEGDKIIVIIRTREENINSMMRNDKTFKRSQAERCYSQGLGEFKKIRNKLVISLSDLTHDPEKTMRQVCEYIGVEFETGMLSAAGYNTTYANHLIEHKR